MCAFSIPDVSAAGGVGLLGLGGFRVVFRQETSYLPAVRVDLLRVLYGVEQGLLLLYRVRVVGNAGSFGRSSFGH